MLFIVILEHNLYTYFKSKFATQQQLYVFHVYHTSIASFSLMLHLISSYFINLVQPKSIVYTKSTVVYSNV